MDRIECEVNETSDFIDLGPLSTSQILALGGHGYDYPLGRFDEIAL